MLKKLHPHDAGQKAGAVADERVHHISRFPITWGFVCRSDQVPTASRIGYRGNSRAVRRLGLRASPLVHSHAHTHRSRRLI